MTNINKLNIILDLDECLIHSILYSDIKSIKKIEKSEFNNFKNKLKKIGIYVDIFRYDFINNREDYSLFFKRPYLKEFLIYLFQNYNVSVWSRGYYTYVDEICNRIFTKAQRKKIKYIFGGKSISKGYDIYYDIVNKKEFYNFTKTKGAKDISMLFNIKPYSTIFNKDNTILIDDDKNHLKFNKNKNVIQVKKWYFYDCNDTILLDIINYLKKNKKGINPSKVKHFRKQSKKIYHKNKSNKKSISKKINQSKKTKTLKKINSNI